MGGKDKGWFPWHDTEFCVEGPAAWDFWTAFEQHWRHQLSEHVNQLLPLEQVDAKRRCGSIAVFLRSICGTMISCIRVNVMSTLHSLQPQSNVRSPA